MAMTPSSPDDHMTHVDHPFLGDEGHNCPECIDQGDTLNMCWPQNHWTSLDFELFVRRVVEKIGRYQDDGKGTALTPAEKVGRAVRMSWHLFGADASATWSPDDGETVTYTAALCVVPMKGT